MTMITPSYLGETIEYSSLHACRSTLEDPTNPDGANPYAGLTLGPGGNFYGTTYQYGAGGFGTVFRITPVGTLTTLHTFSGIGSDGAYPYATVTLGPDGNFYGTTIYGGDNNHMGTVFRISTTGKFKTLWSF